MRLEIRGFGLAVDEQARSYIERRFQFALGRFASRISRVSVSLTDMNGPRGGRDLRCRASVQIMPAGFVNVEVTDDDLGTVTDRAADRAGVAVSRELDRRRDHRGSVSASGLPT